MFIAKVTDLKSQSDFSSKATVEKPGKLLHSTVSLSRKYACVCLLILRFKKCIVCEIQKVTICGTKVTENCFEKI